MKFIIPYPKTKKEMSAWNKRYGLNAIYSGKHWTQRKADKDFWHDLVQVYLRQQKVPRKLFDKPILIIFRWNDNLDCSNHAYMAKLIEDGLKGYLIKDDNRKYVKGMLHFFHDKDYIEIEIKELDFPDTRLEQMQEIAED